MCTSDECSSADRRSFLARGLAAGAAMLAGVRAQAARRRIESREVSFPTMVGAVRGYLAVPTGRSSPGVVLTHGEFGLPQTHRETADELASSGFAALAIERFSRIQGMTWQDLQADDRGAGRYRAETFAREEIEEGRAALDWLGHLDRVDAARLGIVGFCGGGIRAIRLAALDPRVQAVAAFYPPPRIPAQYKNVGDPSPDLLELSTLPTCRLQIHFGAEDYIVKAPDMELLATRAREAGAHVEVYEYTAAGHAFYDRTDASAYRPQAAATARGRYLNFLRESLARARVTTPPTSAASRITR
jgi:carboxymethylenebutenolidase